MKIIILGAGQVGGSLAEHLASEANDITVVDTDGDRLRDLDDRLDIRTVQGRGSLPNILRQAGADDAGRAPSPEGSTCTATPGVSRTSRSTTDP